MKESDNVWFDAIYKTVHVTRETMIYQFGTIISEFSKNQNVCRKWIIIVSGFDSIMVKVSRHFVNDLTSYKNYWPVTEFENPNVNAVIFFQYCHWVDVAVDLISSSSGTANLILISVNSVSP